MASSISEMRYICLSRGRASGVIAATKETETNLKQVTKGDTMTESCRFVGALRSQFGEASVTITSTSKYRS
jgi:hypothetical protein